MAVLWASGFTWCEALSPGVPKPSAALRDYLWSEVSFLRPFWISRSVPEAGFGNRVPKPSAGPPKKVWAPTPATGTNGNSRDDHRRILALSAMFRVVCKLALALMLPT